MKRKGKSMIIYAVQEGDKILKVSKDKQYLVDYMLTFPSSDREKMQLIKLKQLKGGRESHG